MSDDELEQLLKRSRASRDRINARLAALGEPTVPIRSPLKERNSSTKVDSGIRDRSPLKSKSSPVKTTTTTTTTTRFSSSPTKSDPIKKITSETRITSSPSQTRTPGRSNSREEESFNREITEKTTEIVNEPLLSPKGGKQTYTKTTITETEEKFEKKEVYKFTEVRRGNGASPVRLPDYEFETNLRKSESSKFEPPVPKNVFDSKTVTFKNSPVVRTVYAEDDDDETGSEESENTSPTMGSPSRFGSCRDTSLSKNRSEDGISSPLKSRSPSPSKLRSAEKLTTPSNIPADDDDWDLASARRKRLQALASKFRHCDEDDEETVEKARSNNLTLATAAASCSPNRRDRTKLVDVDKELCKIGNKTKNLASDAGFLSSLKAQGFEETQSKSKLVYDFNNRGRSESPGRRGNSSPAAAARSQSPYKVHPHQFIAPQKNVGVASPVANKPAPANAYRSVSPTRMVSSPSQSTSLFRPHPLQFVSPQRAAEVAALAKAEPEGPPKPARTFATSTVRSQDAPEVPTKTWRTEKTVAVTPVSKSPVTKTSSSSPSKSTPTTAAEPESLTDTASRRTIIEKRNLFDGQASSPGNNKTPDPAMLPMSERRKLFEKNLTAPKPIARFGESVTPAMLSKAQTSALSTPNVRPPPKSTMTEPAWKRKRELSPERPFLTPRPSERSPPKSAVLPSNTGASKLIEKSRRLFENADDDNWRENEIARKQEEQKEKDLEVVLGRFSHQRAHLNAENPEADREKSPERKSPPRTEYPGVNSLKKIKVSPPKPGQLYPDLEEIHDERPDTAMSDESLAPSEAASLGTAIKRVASNQRRDLQQQTRMSTICEDVDDDSDDEEMEFSTADDHQINDLLDEAMDNSNMMSDEGPTPPKMTRNSSPGRRGQTSSPSGTSAGSWEFEDPSRHRRDFESPKQPLPLVETENGPAPVTDLLHSVSFYRKSKPVTQFTETPVRKIVRNHESISEETIQDEASSTKEFNDQIKKLQEDISEQMQRRLQASKALDVCQSKNEFEGSCERVEFERLLLEAHHKYAAATAELNRLKSNYAKPTRRSSDSLSKGTLSISGLALQLKQEFVRMISSSKELYEDVHYFVCLVKYRSQVIASQMVSTSEGVSRGGKLVFTNLININDLDFDFRIYLEVYGLQTPKEHLSHEAKYHIKKEKSVFNLTPLKKLKKQESRFVGGSRHENPVNNLTIRKPKFGLVGYMTITIDSLKLKSFRLEKVPSMSPLEGGIEMRLSVHSESRVEESGFLTIFMEVNGLGNWCRRWCRLKDNTLFFWKYPEEEESKEPCLQISLHTCVTDNVTLAPREICSRMNTFMLENQRPIHPDDKEGQNIRLDHKQNLATLRYLLMADTREERLQWCSVVNKSLETLRAWDPTSARPRSNSQSSSCPASDEDTASTTSSTVIW